MSAHCENSPGDKLDSSEKTDCPTDHVEQEANENCYTYDW